MTDSVKHKIHLMADDLHNRGILTIADEHRVDRILRDVNRGLRPTADDLKWLEMLYEEK